jgi:hypothetical protein
MGTGFLQDRDRLLRIEIGCTRVSQLLERARRLETKGRFGMAAAARERAADELRNLERPDPTLPAPARRCAGRIGAGEDPSGPLLSTGGPDGAPGTGRNR